MYSYGNLSGSLKWKHVFNAKLYGVMLAVRISPTMD